MQKSWMWHNENSGGVVGAIIDLEEDYVRWFEDLGCNCGDSGMEQTISDFRENGSRFLVPPADVRAEMTDFVLQSLEV